MRVTMALLLSILIAVLEISFLPETQVEEWQEFIGFMKYPLIVGFAMCLIQDLKELMRNNE